jgi:hypothetical protein
MTKSPIIIFLITTLLFSSCIRPADLCEEEVYTILNEIITDDSLSFSPTLSSTLDEPRFDSAVRSRFYEDDVTFILRQMKLFADLQIKPNKIKRPNWKTLMQKNTSPFALIVQGRPDTIPYSYFSLPIISADRKKVILTIGQGGGFMRGGHETFMYEKSDNHWTCTEKLDAILVNKGTKQRQVTAVSRHFLRSGGQMLYLELAKSGREAAER